MFRIRKFMGGTILFVLVQTMTINCFAAYKVSNYLANASHKTIFENKIIEMDTTLFNVVVDDKDELIVVQWKGINYEDREVQLMDAGGKIVQTTWLYTGSTVAYFDIQTLYNGEYLVRLSSGKTWFSRKIKIKK